MPTRHAKRSRTDESFHEPERLHRLMDIAKEESIPPYMKVVVDVMMEMNEEIKAANRRNRELLDEMERLRRENADLLSKLNTFQSASSPEKPTDSVVVSQPQAAQEADDDPDLKRAIVIRNLPEPNCPRSVDNVFHDLASVTEILAVLNVECLPKTVYRMGKPSSNHPRLLKVILPTSRFQKQVLRNASRLRFTPFRDVFLRESLTWAERKRRREERSGASSTTWSRGAMPRSGDSTSVNQPPAPEMQSNSKPSNPLPNRSENV